MCCGKKLVKKMEKCHTEPSGDYMELGRASVLEWGGGVHMAAGSSLQLHCNGRHCVCFEQDSEEFVCVFRLDPEHLFDVFFEFAKPTCDNEETCVLQRFPDHYADAVRHSLLRSCIYFYLFLFSD